MEIDKNFLDNDDSTYRMSLIGKRVVIKTVDNKMYTGVVYVIDPKSNTFVLTRETSSGKTQLDFIFHHSIKSLEVTSDCVENAAYLFENIQQTENVQTLEWKKARLKAWLKENLIDVEEDGTALKLDNQFRIEYPYGHEQCMCSSTIVLHRIQTIIKNMPVDYFS